MINKKWRVYFGTLVGSPIHIVDAPSVQEACEYFGVYGLTSITKVEVIEGD